LASITARNIGASAASSVSVPTLMPAAAMTMSGVPISCKKAVAATCIAGASRTSA